MFVGGYSEGPESTQHGLLTRYCKVDTSRSSSSPDIANKRTEAESEVDRQRIIRVRVRNTLRILAGGSLTDIVDAFEADHLSITTLFYISSKRLKQLLITFTFLSLISVSYAI